MKRISSYKEKTSKRRRGIERVAGKAWVEGCFEARGVEKKSSISYAIFTLTLI